MQIKFIFMWSVLHREDLGWKRGTSELGNGLFLFTMYIYLTIRLQARVFYEQIVNEAQPSWLSLVENEGE